MAQTSTFIPLGVPSGGVSPVSMQVGTHAFTTSGTSVNLDTPFQNILFAAVVPAQTAGADTGDVDDLLCVIAADQLGGITDRAVAVTRQTGGVSGLAFSYIIIGN